MPKQVVDAVMIGGATIVGAVFGYIFAQWPMRARSLWDFVPAFTAVVVGALMGATVWKTCDYFDTRNRRSD